MYSVYVDIVSVYVDIVSVFVGTTLYIYIYIQMRYRDIRYISGLTSVSRYIILP